MGDETTVSKEALMAGAPDALKWITKRELQAREDYEAARQALNEAIADEIENAPDKDGTDFARITQVARQNLEFEEDRLLVWQKSLLLYDKSIPTEKRDTSEKISREDGERLLKLFGINMRGACEQLITGICQDVLGCRNEKDVHRLIADKLRETMKAALDSAVRENHLPLWCKAALGEVL